MGSQVQDRQKILVVDDAEINRSILADMLGGEYEIIEAANGALALSILQDQATQISLMLLDIVMPVMDGFQVLESMQQPGWIKDIPVIIISAENMPAYVDRAYDLGVADYVQRPFDAKIIRRRVTNSIMLYAKQKHLMDMVARQMHKKEKESQLLVEVLGNVVEFRSGEIGSHVWHMRTLTQLLLEQLVKKTGQYALTPGDISLISAAATLHDIGKVAIPAAILNKHGQLTGEEFELVKTHTIQGAAMLEQLSLAQNEPLAGRAYEICRWHHERYDGTGYPDGCKGDEIPISAQVVSLADVYDALTSRRVYRPAFFHGRAMEMIQSGECGYFNPLLLECLAEVAQRIAVQCSGVQQRHLKWELQNVKQQAGEQKELTASDRTLRLLERERTKYQFFASMSREIQFEFTVNPNILTVSEWGANYLGIDEILVKPSTSQVLYQVIGDKPLKELADMLRHTTPENPVVEYNCPINVRGEWRWGKIISRAMWSGSDPVEYQGAIGKFVDIHEEHNRIEVLEKIASHDGLTGLLNRGSVQQQVDALLGEGLGRKFALVVVDLDYFKEANDQHGHLFGDRVLKYVAERLRKSVRSTDLAARVGGDEFLVFVEYSDKVYNQVTRIFNALSGVFEGFPLSVSMGVAQTTGIQDRYEVLFRRADRALYAAKGKGRKCWCFYDDSMEHLRSVLSPIESDESGD